MHSNLARDDKTVLSNWFNNEFAANLYVNGITFYSPCIALVAFEATEMRCPKQFSTKLQTLRTDE